MTDWCVPLDDGFTHVVEALVAHELRAEPHVGSESGDLHALACVAYSILTCGRHQAGPGCMQAALEQLPSIRQRLLGSDLLLRAWFLDRVPLRDSLPLLQLVRTRFLLDCSDDRNQLDQAIDRLRISPLPLCVFAHEALIDFRRNVLFDLSRLEKPLRPPDGYMPLALYLRRCGLGAFSEAIVGSEVGRPEIIEEEESILTVV